MFRPKQPRVVNQGVIDAVRARDTYCLMCGAPPMEEPHHIITRANLGPDTPENLVMLCYDHHRAAHDGGLGRVELQRLLRRKYGYSYPGLDGDAETEVAAQGMDG